MSEQSDARRFSNLRNAVPAYDSFYTVDTLRARDERLASEYDHVAFDIVGESTGGEEMWAVTVGSGSETALMFAAPHPNEPIGCMTLDFLAHELAENDSLRESFDTEFVLVKAADPDGLRLNEGWFDGPFTLSNYAQNYYRPGVEEQVEWTFPFEYGDYQFDDPVPETKVLMDLIDDHEPGFIYSLHNAGFGGAYYYLSEPFADLHATLHEIPAANNIPLHLGEPEMPTMEEFDDAIYRMPTAEALYEAMGEHGNQDPTDVMAGAGSFEYAQEVNDDVVELVVELPYFREPRITDQTEIDRSREDVIVEGYGEVLEMVEAMSEQFDAIEDLLPDGRLKRLIETATNGFPAQLEFQQEWARSAEETNQPATVAQQMDAEYVMKFYAALNLGTFLRLVDKTAMQAGSDEYERLVDARRTVEREFHETMATLTEELDYEPIPIRDLVTVQARAGLACLAHVQDRAKSDATDD